MNQSSTQPKEPFFNRFTATRDRPPAFQVAVLILVVFIVTLALTSALLKL
jgi:hypothetical protein